MSRFITFYHNVRIRVVRLAESLGYRLATIKQAARDHLAAVGSHVTALASPVRRAIGAGVTRVRALVTPGLASAARLLVPALRRAAAQVRPVRAALVAAAGVPLAYLMTRVAVHSALEVGTGLAQLALLAFFAHVSLGLVSCNATATLRRGMRVAAAAALVWIGTAGLSMGAAIDAGPAVAAVVPAAVAPARPIVADGAAAAQTPGRHAPDANTRADRRTRRRAAAGNGRA